MVLFLPKEGARAVAGRRDAAAHAPGAGSGGGKEEEGRKGFLREPARAEHGGGGGGRVRPGLGQRAAPAAGGAGARDRGGAAERGVGDPGALQGEAQRAPLGAPGRAVRRRRAEGGGRALRADPLPHAGGDRAAPRGLQLLGAQGLPDGAEAHRLRPPEDRGGRPHVRADAGVIAAGPGEVQADPWRGWPAGLASPSVHLLSVF